MFLSLTASNSGHVVTHWYMLRFEASPVIIEETLISSEKL